MSSSPFLPLDILPLITDHLFPNGAFLTVLNLCLASKTTFDFLHPVLLKTAYADAIIQTRALSYAADARNADGFRSWLQAMDFPRVSDRKMERVFDLVMRWKKAPGDVDDRNRDSGSDSEDASEPVPTRTQGGRETEYGRDAEEVAADGLRLLLDILDQLPTSPDKDIGYDYIRDIVGDITRLIPDENTGDGYREVNSYDTPAEDARTIWVRLTLTELAQRNELEWFSKILEVYGTRRGELSSIPEVQEQEEKEQEQGQGKEGVPAENPKWSYWFTERDSAIGKVIQSFIDNQSRHFFDWLVSVTADTPPDARPAATPLYPPLPRLTRDPSLWPLFESHNISFIHALVTHPTLNAEFITDYLFFAATQGNPRTVELIRATVNEADATKANSYSVINVPHPVRVYCTPMVIAALLCKLGGVPCYYSRLWEGNARTYTHIGGEAAVEVLKAFARASGCLTLAKSYLRSGMPPEDLEVLGKPTSEYLEKFVRWVRRGGAKEPGEEGENLEWPKPEACKEKFVREGEGICRQCGLSRFCLGANGVDPQEEHEAAIDDAANEDESGPPQERPQDHEHESDGGPAGERTEETEPKMTLKREVVVVPEDERSYWRQVKVLPPVPKEQLEQPPVLAYKHKSSCGHPDEN